MYSKDPKNFEKKIAFACSENYGVDVFELIKSPFDITSTHDQKPTIVWNNFDFTSHKLDENLPGSFNSKNLPTFEEVCTNFSNESFIPKTVTDRASVKSLKFPIVGVGNDSKEFKTYGKFKKSEMNFSKFREKIVPTTRFDVIAFKDETIHIQERINTLGFDVDSSRFKHNDSIDSIISKISESYPIDFYHVSLLESKGNLYLESITNSLALSPSQSIKMYETAYRKCYDSALPNWFKKQLFETYVQPYYKNRYFDSLLIKPKYSINFEKYANS